MAMYGNKITTQNMTRAPRRWAENKDWYSGTRSSASLSNSGSAAKRSGANYTDLSTQYQNYANSIQAPQRQQTTYDPSTNQYKQMYEDAYNAIKGREKFSYDQSKDPLYQQYAQMYQQNAKLGMENTVGQVSALTGGYGNSYAQTAGQAMYQQVMGGLNEKALDLYNAALDTYNSETNDLYNQYNAAADMYSAENDNLRYQYEMAEKQYQYDYDQAMNERNYYNNLAADYYNRGYQAERDAISDARYDSEWAYQQYRDSVSDARYNSEWEYQKERDKVSDERYASEWEYQKERDKVSDERYASEWAYNTGRDAIEDARYNNNLAHEYNEAGYKTKTDKYGNVYSTGERTQEYTDEYNRQLTAQQSEQIKQIRDDTQTKLEYFQKQGNDNATQAYINNLSDTQLSALGVSGRNELIDMYTSGSGATANVSNIMYGNADENGQRGKKMQVKTQSNFGKSERYNGTKYTDYGSYFAAVVNNYESRNGVQLSDNELYYLWKQMGGTEGNFPYSKF